MTSALMKSITTKAGTAGHPLAYSGSVIHTGEMRFPARARLITSVVLGGAAALTLAAGAAGTAAAAASSQAAAVRTASTTAGGLVRATPSKGLAGGETVRVTGTGITPLASVQVIQCEAPDGDPADFCAPALTTTASSSGTVSVQLTLTDPVWLAQEIGDSIPIYCRADQCRVLLSWTDGEGQQQTLVSPRLYFTGAPATITVNQSANLHGHQLVGVRGTAFGAQGHQFEVLEEACYAIVQGSGCYGALPAADGTVGSNGRYYVHYRVLQHLADGTDCNDPGILGQCELTVVILTNGKPDDSFGVSSVGQPMVDITFRS
jgi:Neocarzinostatin family